MALLQSMRKKFRIADDFHEIIGLFGENEVILEKTVAELKLIQ